MAWRTTMTIAGVLGALAGCPGDDGGGDEGGVTGNNSGPVSASNEDGPEPVTCEELGGTCDCFGSCGPGLTPAPGGTCPQPPDEAGACGQECCVPVGGTAATTTTTTATTADSSATAATSATTASTTTADDTAG